MIDGVKNRIAVTIWLLRCHHLREFISEIGIEFTVKTNQHVAHNSD
jgi:hypothetical protein